ncbi:Hypothetical protein POVN_LOCUS87 [uncultured virus]|nr:Hypothetical protein POVN_LOCUS87 [uncultured virus]
MAGVLRDAEKAAQEVAYAYDTLSLKEKTFIAHWLQYRVHCLLLHSRVPVARLTRLEINIKAKGAELLTPEETKVPAEESQEALEARGKDLVNHFTTNYRDLLMDLTDTVVMFRFSKYLSAFGLADVEDEAELELQAQTAPDALADVDLTINVAPNYNALMVTTVQGDADLATELEELVEAFALSYEVGGEVVTTSTKVATITNDEVPTLTNGDKATSAHPGTHPD